MRYKIEPRVAEAGNIYWRLYSKDYWWTPIWSFERSLRTQEDLDKFLNGVKKAKEYKTIYA